jgi:hypothetical protein
MSDARDYKLDVSARESNASDTASRATRAFIGVHFACCGVYRRVYRDAGDPSYIARCPLCGRELVFRVGAAGTNARAFVVK